MVLELALLALVFFLPGFFLTNALFPARGSLGGDLDLLYRVFLGLLLSVALVVAYGVALVLLAEGDRVRFLPETLFPGLGLLAALFFLAGIVRGAYPRLNRLLGRPVPPPAVERAPDRGLHEELVALTARLEAARREAQARRGTPAGDRAGEEARRLEAEKERLEAAARRLWT